MPILERQLASVVQKLDDMEFASRNHGVRPGQHLHDMIDLPGWEEQSVWGWDPGMSTFYAQLWRNGNAYDRPDVSISGASRTLPWPGSVALEIVEQVGTDSLAAMKALGIASPEPRLQPRRRLRSEIKDAKRIDHPFSLSRAHALTWVYAGKGPAPGSGVERRRRPTPAEVEAEHHLVTGHVYREPGQTRYTGADQALWWALGH